MCGIIGVLAARKTWQVKSLLYRGILELLNRGYDSVGVSLLDQGGAIVRRSTDRNDVLTFLKEEEKNIQNGMAHTRWATHGRVCEENAHPHRDTLQQKILVVHNGIVENFQPLRESLSKKNINFASETDTEVIANLIADIYFQASAEATTTHVEMMAESIVCALSRVEGTYGVIVQHIDFPEYMFCARKGSPILVGLNDDQTMGMIVSEKSAFQGLVGEYISLSDDSLFILEANEGRVEYHVHRSLHPSTHHLNDRETDMIDEQHASFRCNTEKEIWEQPHAFRRCIHFGSRFGIHQIHLGGLEAMEERLVKCKNVFLFGCGTSYHAALLGAYFINRFTDQYSAQAFDGSEFQTLDLPKGIYRGCCVFFSQSGETLDLFVAWKAINRLFPEWPTLGVINTVDSLIARSVDGGVYMNCGRERGVASSKSFLCSVVVVWMITRWFQTKTGATPDRLSDMDGSLLSLPEQITTSLPRMREVAVAWAARCHGETSCLILGKGVDFFIAKEAALKIKELAYLHAEAYSSTALKHGPFALLHQNSLVFVLATDKEWHPKSLNAVQEVVSRQASVFLVCTPSFRAMAQFETNENFKLFLVEETEWAFLMANTFFQMLALELAFQKGHNPDFPRNLAKVVTVE